MIKFGKRIGQYGAADSRECAPEESRLSFFPGKKNLNLTEEQLDPPVFEETHKGRVCVCAFIEVSVRAL